MSNKQLIKQIRKLRQPNVRQRTGTFYAEGNRIVAQAISAGANIKQCVIAPSMIKSDKIWASVETLRAKQTPVIELSADEFSSISFKRNLSGIGIVVRIPQISLRDVRLTDGVGWVALVHVSNAGNLGAVLRTCDSVGAKGVILLGDTVDAHHPMAVKASMGAIFSLQLVTATMAEFGQWKMAQNVMVVGTSDSAELSYRHFSYAPPLVLLMGSERLGLNEDEQAICDAMVQIPMVGTSDSLNLAVATAVVLYEVFHQMP